MPLSGKVKIINYKSGLQLVIADKKGKVYNIPYLEPAGMKAGQLCRLKKEDLIELPHGSELFALPERFPVGYNPDLKEFIILDKNPFLQEDKQYFAVAAFVSPGYTSLYNSAYNGQKGARPLPLFSYSAVCFSNGRFYTPAVMVDREKRQDLRHMPLDKVKRNARSFQRLFPKNRLVKHLVSCALVYGCPAGKNFFLQRHEAPLPTSRVCNARCLGCISYQPEKLCPVTQPRIKFTPIPEEVAEIALFHISNAREPVVSFGQGCEGEPLLCADIIEKAIRLIRRNTSKGIINLNTNASKPDSVGRLFDAGLDSMRVSLNSARKAFYMRYFNPVSYTFEDVIKSIKEAKKRKGFVSVNYLTMPGFTDEKAEADAFRDFIGRYNIDMVQWRNLNYDPLKYFEELRINPDTHDFIGIDNLIRGLKKSYPALMMGYFNPSRARISKGSLLAGHT